MCNLGFVHALRDAGIEVVQTAVGDRWVLQSMLEHGYSIGGEQSGHTIFLEHNSTGDGLITACQFLSVCVRGNKTAAEAAGVMRRFPQQLINVKVSSKDGWEENAAISEAVAAAEAALGDAGRVLVRASGTEPLIRVMVEASEQSAADTHAKAIADVVQQQIGA